AVIGRPTTGVMTRLWLFLCAILCACGPFSGPPGGTVLVAGDSTMAWNGTQNASVADHLGRMLPVDVDSVARSGARFSHPRPGPRRVGFDIRAQVRGATSRWVVMTGGANELGTECICGACGGVARGLISADGTRGEIPETVTALRTRGVRVVWAIYYTVPRRDGPWEACTPSFDHIAMGVRAMAAGDPGILTYDMARAVPQTRADLFAPDGLHPSGEGSRRIARGIADALRAADPTLR
ncbi:MAG: SGNH/GDSL hydrolase family protein, partial [Pseudomonadota bacterium]